MTDALGMTPERPTAPREEGEPELMSDTKYAKKCPRCTSPDPNRHPAMQFEGEVQLCEHHWHWRTEAKRAERAAPRESGYWREPEPVDV